MSSKNNTTFDWITRFETGKSLIDYLNNEFGDTTRGQSMPIMYKNGPIFITWDPDKVDST